MLYAEICRLVPDWEDSVYQKLVVNIKPTYLDLLQQLAIDYAALNHESTLDLLDWSMRAINLLFQFHKKNVFTAI